MSRFYLRAVVVSSLVATFSLAQPIAAPPEPPKSPAPIARPTRGPDGDMGSLLIIGLKATEGCLGVNSCRWEDGKQSIVAWFEDKAAASDWYFSSTHQAMIDGRTDGSKENKEPMKYVTNEEQPIMVIATLTPAKKPELPGIDIPISQISIELFAPLPGGAQIGGRVSPARFQVPHMRNYTPSDPPPIEGNGQTSKAISR